MSSESRGISSALLPVHGFVLAGGRSSRMGADKAMLAFGGRAMVEIAVEKLRSFCAEVSIAGNRDDLSRFAEVVQEERVEAGPAAGVEAGLRAARQEWVMFVPVDVPLVPAELLRGWAEWVVAGGGDDGGTPRLRARCLASCLSGPGVGGRQPAFSMLHVSCLAAISGALDRDERRLSGVLEAVEEWFGDGAFRVADARPFARKSLVTKKDLEFWFSNVNTPEELADTEALADTAAGRGGG